MTHPDSRPTPASEYLRPARLSPPTLQDNTGDMERLVSALAGDFKPAPFEASAASLRSLPAILRNHDHQAICLTSVFRGLGRIYDVLPPKGAFAAGLAVDLGTTRVNMALYDLFSGQKLGAMDFENPQTKVGPDILIRIHHAATPEGLEELRRLIVDKINSRMVELACRADVKPDQIRLAALAGNTAMTHLFLGADPRWIIREPYIPAVNRPGFLRADDLSLAIHPQSPVFLFPNVGSYFGGDLISGILASGLHEKEAPCLLVDVGTNAEVVLGNRHWMVACAGAAGPALEGGVTKIGAPAGPGIIDHVEIDGRTGNVRWRTIGNLPPKGICGSGLIDLAAQMFCSSMLDLRGKMVPENCGSLCSQRDGIGYFTLVPREQSAGKTPLEVSEVDLDSLIRSKAAMYTILETLFSTVGLGFDDIETFYVAGTFGSVLDPASAVCIGMIPDLPIERFQTLGNSSLSGAANLLFSNKAPDEAEAVCSKITYMELNVNQDFMNRFSAARFLPHTDPLLFPSVAERRRI